MLVSRCGKNAVAHGCSGNGWFALVAIEPTEPTRDDTQRISKLLQALNEKLGTEQVKIDRAVANPARLIPAPGTWKRKGEDLAERPHRRVTFCCPATIERVPLGELV